VLIANFLKTIIIANKWKGIEQNMKIIYLNEVGSSSKSETVKCYGLTCLTFFTLLKNKEKLTFAPYFMSTY
jgi:hypothetical protein